MPVRRPSLVNPSRQASVEPWMAWQKLHCLNPSVQTAIKRAGYDGYSSGVCDASGYETRVSGRVLLVNWVIVNGLKDTREGHKWIAATEHPYTQCAGSNGLGTA
jgi:hypothetical protein